MPPDSAEPKPGDQLAEYYHRLDGAHLAPLWESLAALAPAEPSPQARPFQWVYRQVRDHLMEAGTRVTAEEAERRVLVLANPTAAAPLQATDTLYAGLQLILPGEVARPHRHTQAALRFVLEGEGAFTTVDGRRAPMRPGDLIITPAWSWHEHGGGPGPVVWLDGLDVPLVAFLRAGFREEPDLPPSGGVSPPIQSGAGLAPKGEDRQFAWLFEEERSELQRLQASREPDPWLGLRLDYRHRDGRPVMPTLGASLTLLPKGFASRPYRSTDSAVAVLLEGRVEAEVGGEGFGLRPGDILALPGWTRRRFTALKESVLFAFSDRPAHEALGLWREQRGAANAA